jgi:ZIP family zinc transporter
MLTMLADAMMPEAFEHGGKVVGLLTVLGFLMAAILAVME